MNSQPWGTGPAGPPPPSREPIVKVPPAALVLALSMPVLFWLQARLPDMGMAWAFYPTDLSQTLGWPGIVTAMLLHGSWTHAGLNAVTAVCFAPPVARVLPGARGAGARTRRSIRGAWKSASASGAGGSTSRDSRASTSRPRPRSSGCGRCSNRCARSPRRRTIWTVR